LLAANLSKKKRIIKYIFLARSRHAAHNAGLRAESLRRSGPGWLSLIYHPKVLLRSAWILDPANVDPKGSESAHASAKNSGAETVKAGIVQT
jgi:hypothetical protein